MLPTTDPRSWENHATDNARKWSIKEFLSEPHHQLYGRPWAIGRRYVDFLLAQGLKSTDMLLDFGCGAGRVGIWLIPFLEPGRYVGIDSHNFGLAAFRQYEIPLHGLANKKPRLVLDDSCEPHRLNIVFDVILDLWVTQHFNDAKAMRVYRSFALALRPGGRVVTNQPPKIGIENLKSLDLRLVHTKRRANFVSDDFWHVIERSP
jgi:SAM-dependent methyltransferase